MNAVSSEYLFLLCNDIVWMFERIKPRETATDANNNNDVTSTSTLPFVEIAFYIFTS